MANLDINLFNKHTNNYCTDYACIYMHVGEHFILYRKTYLVHTWTWAAGTILSLAMVKGGCLCDSSLLYEQRQMQWVLDASRKCKNKFYESLRVHCSVTRSWRLMMWPGYSIKIYSANFALVSYQLRHWSLEVWCSLKLLRIKLMFTDRLCFRAYSYHNILFSSVNLNC